MKIGHIELFVDDPASAMDFYTKVLGFKLVDVQQGQFVWVDAGSLSILLRPSRSRDAVDSYDQAATGIVLYTDDLDQTAADLTARGLLFRGNDGSPRCLTFEDPDGHWFQLVDPADH